MKMKYLIGALLLCATAATITSCNDDDDYAVATGNIVTTIETGDAAVTATSASITGRVLDLSKQSSDAYTVGVVYGTNPDPTTAGSKKTGAMDADGVVSTTLTGLTKGTTYYYAQFVTLQGVVTKYGEVKSFVATDAKIATAGATNITATKATVSATTTGLDGIMIEGQTTMNYGFKISTSEADVQNGVDYPIATTSNTVTTQIKGLLPGTTYYYTSYFEIGDGYAYGDTKSFTTQSQTMEYVDLGTSVLWAKYNIGAEAESEQGVLVGFGDQTFSLTSTIDNDYTPWDIAGTEDDVLYNLNIDGTSTQKSKMPTAAQVEELISATTQTTETVDGVTGIRFTAKNGNSIFLPYTGYRSGKEATTTAAGYYWTGTVNEINGDYAQTIKIDALGASKGISARHLGLAIRSVRQNPEVSGIDNSKLVVGDIEGNGRIRIEIYNEYGASKNDPAFNVNQIKFDKNMVVTFKLTGLDGNYKDGAAQSNIAGLEYSDPNWAISRWSSLDGDKYDANVTGDGSYTVWMETETGTSGAVVFCVDIKDLYNDLVDPTLVKAEIESIKFDVDPKFYMDYSKTEFNNKDGNGTDGRIEIYNEYGNTKGNGVDASALAFTGNMVVNFTINGIDGNLVSGASANYKTELSFADASWDPSYWGGQSYGRAYVTGDGTYEVYASLKGKCEGAVVWTIELYDLWKDLVDPTKVSVTINSVTTPGK